MKGKERGGGVFSWWKEKKNLEKEEIFHVFFFHLPFFLSRDAFFNTLKRSRARELKREREREEEYIYIHTHTHTHTRTTYLQLCHLLRHFYSLPSCTTIIQRRFLGEETAAGEVILHQSFRRRGRRYEKPAAGGKARVLLSPV